MSLSKSINNNLTLFNKKNTIAINNNSVSTKKNTNTIAINFVFDVLTIIKLNNIISKSNGIKLELGFTNTTNNARNLFNSFKIFCSKTGIDMRELGTYPEHSVRDKKTGKLSLDKVRRLFRIIIRFIAGMYLLRFIFNNTREDDDNVIIECNKNNIGLSIIADYYAYYRFISKERKSEFNYLDYKKFLKNKKSFIKYNEKFPIQIRNIYYDLQNYTIPVDITDNMFGDVEFICYHYYYNYNLIDPNAKNEYHTNLKKLHEVVEMDINNLVEDIYKSNKRISYMDKLFSDMIVDLYEIFN